MTDEQMKAAMAEVKNKMGREVEAFEGDISESMITELVGMMAKEIRKQEVQHTMKTNIEGEVFAGI